MWGVRGCVVCEGVCCVMMCAVCGCVRMWDVLGCVVCEGSCAVCGGVRVRVCGVCEGLWGV